MLGKLASYCVCSVDEIRFERDVGKSCCRSAMVNRETLGLDETVGTLSCILMIKSMWNFLSLFQLCVELFSWMKSNFLLCKKYIRSLGRKLNLEFLWLFWKSVCVSLLRLSNNFFSFSEFRVFLSELVGERERTFQSWFKTVDHIESAAIRQQKRIFLSFFVSLVLKLDTDSPSIEKIREVHTKQRSFFHPIFLLFFNDKHRADHTPVETEMFSYAFSSQNSSDSTGLIHWKNSLWRAVLRFHFEETKVDGRLYQITCTWVIV